mmetsp:Transcript_16288/g.28506  ORF Transcript_16288/g.28506 Transcript_16288/m.28506 type:complete len:258 (+) Transcript_16288:60-833(+)
MVVIRSLATKLGGIQRSLPSSARAISRFQADVRMKPSLACYIQSSQFSSSQSSAPSSQRPGPVDLANNVRNIMSLDSETINPYIQRDTYVSPSALIVGNVILNNYSSVMNNVVIRGDTGQVWMSAFNVYEERVTIIATPTHKVLGGSWIWIGQGSVLIGCELGGSIKIGSGCVLEEGSKMGNFSGLLPKSVLKAGVHVPEQEIWGGNPAKFVRKATDDELADFRDKLETVYENTFLHMKEFLPYGAQYLEKEKILGN